VTITTGGGGEIVRLAAEYFGTKDIFSGGENQGSIKKQEVLRSLRDEIQSID